jgi:hypothetical protein
MQAPFIAYQRILVPHRADFSKITTGFIGSQQVEPKSLPKEPGKSLSGFCLNDWVSRNDAIG